MEPVVRWARTKSRHGNEYHVFWDVTPYSLMYRGGDKSLAWPTSRCILFDGENISFDASLVIYVNSTNIPPIMIIFFLSLLYDGT